MGGDVNALVLIRRCDIDIRTLPDYFRQQSMHGESVDIV